MTDQAPQDPAAPAPDAAPACPITDDFLAPNMKKHVDPKAPVPLRMMAAKALVPLAPPDMVGVLFMLTFDQDPNVRDTAVKTASTLPDRILAPALRDEAIKPPVLGWLLEQYWQNESYAEMLVLNGNTPDTAVAAVATKCTLKTAEIIGSNQLRLLRHEDLIRALALNPVAAGALIDGVCDFAVRSGVVLTDVPQMQEARVRLFGPEVAAEPPDPGPTAEELLAEFAEVGQENAPPMEEGKRLTIAQKIMKMSVSQKIKLAARGNKEIRGILLRDSNRLVSVAAIRSPMITEGEIIMQANNKAASEDVLREIYTDREYTKKYTIKLALVKNPKVPQALAMRFLSSLRESDVKSLARDKNVPNVVQMLARKLVDKKGPSGAH